MPITREPVKGDIVEYISPIDDSVQRIEVHHCDDNMCYSMEDEHSDPRCFIWKFPSGEMNKLHTIVEGK